MNLKHKDISDEYTRSAASSTDISIVKPMQKPSPSEKIQVKFILNNIPNA